MDGRTLTGQTKFFFRVDREPEFGSGSNVLLYHINGRPQLGEIEDNFVSWEFFEAQLSGLLARGYRFGTLESGCRGRTVCLTFDDGWATQYQAARILARRGIPATFFITVDNLDRAAFLSTAQVQAMAAMGMTIGSHLLSHDCLTATAFGMTTEQRDNYLLGQIGSSKQFLEEITGKPVEWLAYPFGCYDWTVIKAAQRFYRGAWTTNRLLPLEAGMGPWVQTRIIVRDATRFN